MIPFVSVVISWLMVILMILNRDFTWALITGLLTTFTTGILVGSLAGGML